MAQISDILTDNPVLVIGGGLAVALLLLVAKSGGGGSGGDLPSNIASLQAKTIEANTAIALGGMDLRGRINDDATAVRLAQIQGPIALAIAKSQISSDERIAAAGFATQREMARYGYNTQRAAIDAQRSQNTENNWFGIASLFAQLFGPGLMGGGGASAPAAKGGAMALPALFSTTGGAVATAAPAAAMFI